MALNRTLWHQKIYLQYFLAATRNAIAAHKPYCRRSLMSGCDSDAKVDPLLHTAILGQTSLAQPCY